MRGCFLAFGVLFYLQVSCQDKNELIEYLESYEPSVAMNVNIFIPSFQSLTTDTQEIKLRRANDVWIYVGYRHRQEKNPPSDTVHISNIPASTLKYLQGTGSTFDQVAKMNEGPCYDYNSGYCNFVISTTEIHYIRFRSGQKNKVYKLLLTD